MSERPAQPALGPDTRRLLVVCPTWVGDTVMATPVLRAARAALPEARIAAAVRPGLDELLDGGPWLDETLVLANRGLAGPWRVAAQLRRAAFDAVLLLPNSARWALTASLARIPVRAGYARDGRGRLLTRAVPAPDRARPTSTVAWYADLAAAALGAPVDDRRPCLVVTEAQRRAAVGLLPPDERPLVVLNPGGNRASKRWPAERFAQVADMLAEQRGAAIAVTGGPGEADLVRTVADVAGRARPVDLVARGVTLGALKGVLERAALLVTNDTGPRHVAAALGTPVVSLFGPTDHRWTPVPGAREHLLLAEPFLPEELTADGHPRACRIDRIEVGDVIAAAGEMMRGRRD